MTTNRQTNRSRLAAYSDEKLHANLATLRFHIFSNVGRPAWVLYVLDVARIRAELRRRGFPAVAYQTERRQRALARRQQGALSA